MNLWLAAIYEKMFFFFLLSILIMFAYSVDIFIHLIVSIKMITAIEYDVVKWKAGV